MGIIWGLYGDYMGIIWGLYGDYMGIIWVLLVFNNVDRCPYLVGNCYFNLTR